MTRKAATGWRTTRRLSGEGGGLPVLGGRGHYRSPCSVGTTGSPRSYQARRFGYRLLLAVYVDGPYAESNNAGRQVAHRLQPQERPQGRRRRGEAPRAYGRREHPPVGQGLEPLDRPG